MTRRRNGGRSYGQTRAYMNDITERHTRAMLANARAKAPKRSPDKARVAERKQILAKKGLLDFLEKGVPCPVRLPGNKQGIATGITEEGYVVVKNWDDLFHPKALLVDKPPSK